jgi:hypothetical protein
MNALRTGGTLKSTAVKTHSQKARRLRGRISPELLPIRKMPHDIGITVRKSHAQIRPITHIETIFVIIFMFH